MHIALIGFMGCGKTTVGKGLAQLTGLPFFDLDETIELIAGKSIAAFFATEGEEHFRCYEQQILLELLHNPNPSIIACGGGTPCYHNAIDQLNKYATTIYLQLSADTLYHRLKSEVIQRPMLQNQPDLKKHISNLLAQRKLIYEKAQLIIDVNGKSVSEIVQEIANISM